jgi:hypothetical protein
MFDANDTPVKQKNDHTTLVKLCARKNTIQLKVENIENANNTHIKQKKTTKKRSYF